MSHLTNDDTYYYLQTAWNANQLGFVTFDGLHATNGVQLAWFLVCVVLAALSSTKLVLLYTALSLCAVLNVACYAFIWRIARTLHRPETGAVMAGLWMMVSLEDTYTMGLENSLHGFVIWWILGMALHFLIAVNRDETPPSLLPITIGLVVNAWTRLDSGLFSAVIYAACVGMLVLRYSGFRQFLGAYGRPLAVSLLVAGCGVSAQLVAFHGMGGSILPISALVKTGDVPLEPGTGMLLRLWEVLRLSSSRFFPPLAVKALAVLVMMVVWRSWSHQKQAGLFCFWKLWAIMLVGFGSYHLVIVGFGIDYPAYFSWYRSPLFIFWILSLGGLSIALFDWVGRRRAAASIVLSVVLSIAMGSATAYRFHGEYEARQDRESFLTERYRAAVWVSDHTRKETILASWNTGVLGYFSNRTFINMDGLVNSIEYREQVLRNPDWLGATVAYLRDNRVDYILDVVESPDVRALVGNLTVVRSFAAPGVWGHRMWRVHDGALPFQDREGK